MTRWNILTPKQQMRTDMDNWLVYVVVWWLASVIFGVAVGFAIKKMGGGDTGY